MSVDPEQVRAFWMDEVGPERWYATDPELDDTCRGRFLGAWMLAGDGGLDGWLVAPRSTLALLILLDQLPRNMFRGVARAFATDARARDVAKRAIAQGNDLAIDGLARQFFYLPLMHSEALADQARSVRLFALRGPDVDSLRHARAHRAVIRRFGRFPFRNEALGRATTPAEAAWIEAGGYGAEVRALA